MTTSQFDRERHAWDSYCIELMHEKGGDIDVVSRGGEPCVRPGCQGRTRSGLPLDIAPDRNLCVSCVLATQAHTTLRKSNADKVTQADMDFWRGKAPTMPQVQREDDDPRLR